MMMIQTYTVQLVPTVRRNSGISSCPFMLLGSVRVGSAERPISVGLR
jgi:hypothetical protein